MGKGSLPQQDRPLPGGSPAQQEKYKHDEEPFLGGDSGIQGLLHMQDSHSNWVQAVGPCHTGSHSSIGGLDSVPVRGPVINQHAESPLRHPTSSPEGNRLVIVTKA